MEELKQMIDIEIAKGRRVRLSGGDPCSFPKQSLEIAKYVFEKYGEKISIAHNGSDLEFVKSLVPFLEYVAIDYKAYNFQDMQKITGIKNPKMQQEEIIKLCSENNIIVDLRTPVFGDTEKEQLQGIAELISNYENVFWTLRKYNQVQGCDFPVPEMDFVVKLAKFIKNKYISCWKVS